jgi:hypothetical protein
MRKWVYKQAYGWKNYENEGLLVVWWRKLKAWWAEKRKPREEESARG